MKPSPTTKTYREELNKVPTYIRISVRQSYELSDKIFNLMERNHLTQKDMAEIFKVSQETIAAWIGGNYNFDIETIAKISDYFDELLIKV